ncbi:DUF2141 domain-containing protein [Polaribacter sp.]|nr:DUF2141 domain-containing protein [Polaribacter sp.]
MKFILAIITVTVLFVNQSITAQNQSITATVINATSDEGKVGFALYNKTNFRKTPIQAKEAKIENGISTVIFEDVEPGEYSVICYHDKNSNDKMDFEPNGMPKEDYGTSNNIMSFGPPQFIDSKFLLTDEDVTLKIKF